MKPTARWLRINPLNSDESCWEARTTRPNCKVSKLLTNIFLWNFSTGTMPGIWAGSQKNEDFFFWKNYLTNFKDEGLIDLLFRIFRKTGTVSRNYINLKCQSWTKKNLLIFLRTRIHGVGPTDWYQSERNIWKNIWKKYLVSTLLTRQVLFMVLLLILPSITHTLKVPPYPMFISKYFFGRILKLFLGHLGLG